MRSRTSSRPLGTVGANRTTEPCQTSDTLPMMLSRAVILGTLCFFAGWSLVFVSGHGGNSTGGSEIVWQIGGIMVYASVAILVFAALIAVGSVLRSSVSRLHHSQY